MTELYISACILLLGFFGKSDAFSYHETINTVKKPTDQFTHLLGPEFFPNGSFAFAKVTDLVQSPAALQVSLEVFSPNSPTVSKSSKKFVADGDSSSFNVTSMKVYSEYVIFAISEAKKGGSSKTMIVMWEPFSYPNASLYLPENHYILTDVDQKGRFDVIVNDNDTCRTKNGKCKFQLGLLHFNWEFLDGDLVWPIDHIDYAPYERDSEVLLLRGFDAAGNFKFMESKLPVWKDASTELLSLPQASRSIESLLLTEGLCFIKNPGQDKTVNCLIFDLVHHNDKSIVFDRSVTYSEPISMLHVLEDRRLVKGKIRIPDVLVITKPVQCKDSSCMSLTITRLPGDKSKPITQRSVPFECSSSDIILKVSAMITDGFVIEYICENDHEFVFNSVTTNEA